MPLTKQQVAELRRPFVPEAIGFKVQTNPKDQNGSAVVVAFITARDAIARLNAVAPGDWEDAYSLPAVGKGLACHLTVAGVTRTDVGFALNTDTDMGVKAIYSDAFKRAAVKFEVGGFLYSLPIIRLPARELKQYGQKWFMPDTALKSLRGRYADWLKNTGEAMFGKPLDHGSHEEAQGDIDTTEVPPADVPVDSPVAESPELHDMLRAAIQAKKKTEYKDDAEWFKLVQATPRKDLLKHLAEHYTSLGGDPAKVKAQWQKRA